MTLFLAALLPLLTLFGSHDEIDWGGLAWVLSARVPGTAVGVLVLTLFTERHLGVAVALMVLLGVALTIRAVEVSVRPATLVAAGFVSGVAGRRPRSAVHLSPCSTSTGHPTRSAPRSLSCSPSGPA